ncbi:hypothetical protein B296_00027221 [Ensete ventricosum]|uniref:Uncharacterized protein n=1 Tax=Ensete ventricosum TaxID=4639 RepID=A0A427AQ52_ENSVE|nr:hypothetical protein B296_00027221 [Ensete ventricosum]
MEVSAKFKLGRFSSTARTDRGIFTKTRERRRHRNRETEEESYRSPRRRRRIIRANARGTGEPPRKHRDRPFAGLLTMAMGWGIHLPVNGPDFIGMMVNSWDFSRAKMEEENYDGLTNRL